MTYAAHVAELSLGCDMRIAVLLHRTAATCVYTSGVILQLLSELTVEAYGERVSHQALPSCGCQGISEGCRWRGDHSGKVIMAKQYFLLYPPDSTWYNMG